MPAGPGELLCWCAACPRLSPPVPACPPPHPLQAPVASWPWDVCTRTSPFFFSSCPFHGSFISFPLSDFPSCFLGSRFFLKALPAVASLSLRVPWLLLCPPSVEHRARNATCSPAQSFSACALQRAWLPPVVRFHFDHKTQVKSKFIFGMCSASG